MFILLTLVPSYHLKHEAKTTFLPSCYYLNVKGTAQAQTEIDTKEFFHLVTIGLLHVTLLMPSRQVDPSAQSVMYTALKKGNSVSGIPQYIK